jgi:N-methylhydantoinase B
VHVAMSNTLNTPVEALESELPIRVARYAIREATGGAGQFAGGNGLRRDILFLEQATVTILSERRKDAPYGLSGGLAGAVGENWSLKPEGEEKLNGKVSREVAAGECISIRTPGGGGLGRAR